MPRKTKKNYAIYDTQWRRTGNKQPTFQLKEYDRKLASIYDLYGVGLYLGPELGIRKINHIVEAEILMGKCKVYLTKNFHYF